MGQSNSRTNKRRWRARLHRAGFVSTLVACLAISAFLLASGYESVYNRTLPLVHTLSAVNMSALKQVYDLPAAAHYTSAAYGTFGKPQTLQIPDRSARLNIVAPIYQDNQWLARSSTLHLLIAAQPRAGNIGVAVLYCRAGFRTIDDADLPTPGQNLFVDTDHSWRYVYKVTTAKVYPDSQPYIPADDGKQGKLLVICNDSARHTNDIVEATLLSVQGVEQ